MIYYLENVVKPYNKIEEVTLKLFSGIMAANGGIMRLGFKDGSKDPKMNRRTFMKVMGGLASIPVFR